MVAARDRRPGADRGRETTEGARRREPRPALDVRALRRGAGAEETLRGLQSQRIRDRRAPGARRRSRGPDPVPRFPSWRRSAGAGGDLPSLRSWLGDGPRRGDEAQPGPGRARRDRRPDLHADGPARAQALAGASPAGGGSHQARLGAVDVLAADYMLREDVREHLVRIPDVERIATRIVRLSASPGDLLSLKGALEEIGPLRETLESASSGSSLLSRVLGAMEEPPGVRELVTAAISEESGEIIRPGYSGELDEAREFRDGAHEWLTRFEAEERLKTGLKTLKVGYRDGEGYFIEV